MISKKSDDAISPVIGVMLMLVVTVVIAAAVTIFATGVVGETEAAPVAVLDVEILSNVDTLEEHGTKGLAGPDLWITHLSGEPVDTADIELRFSWTDEYGGEEHSHYSTYSADGFKEEHSQGIAGPDGAGGLRAQALYVKSTMPHQKENPEYGSKNMPDSHFFGDVILTPGLKLTANTDFLVRNMENTNSPFMDVIFDNYNVSTIRTEETTIKKVGFNVQHSTALMKNGDKKAQYDPNCYHCLEYNGFDPDLKIGACSYSNGKFTEGYCHKCKNHPAEECSENNQHCIDKKCIKVQPTGNIIYTTGIMEHLQPGTAVDVMIVHIPSGKAIYDNTVIVQ